MQSPAPENKVVSIFAARDKANAAMSAKEAPEAQAAKSQEDISLKEIIERNTRNQERMAKERSSANKSVLKSYRIKN